MLTLRGAPALSVFRLQKLRTRLQALAGDNVVVDAEFMHFVDVDGALEAHEAEVLDRLLEYGPAHGETRQKAGESPPEEPARDLGIFPSFHEHGFPLPPFK